MCTSSLESAAHEITNVHSGSGASLSHYDSEGIHVQTWRQRIKIVQPPKAQAPLLFLPDMGQHGQDMGQTYFLFRRSIHPVERYCMSFLIS
jgi:hypothetical protein